MTTTTLQEPCKLDIEQTIDAGDYAVGIISLIRGNRYIRETDLVQRWLSPVNTRLTGRWKTVMRDGGECALYIEVVLQAREIYRKTTWFRDLGFVVEYYAVTRWVHENSILVEKKDIVTINECGCSE